MRNILIILLITFILFSCNKENIQEVNDDYRKPYTGLFSFLTIKSTMVMCYDTLPPCFDGWKEINFDTINFSSYVTLIDSNKLKILFGDSIIGIDDNGDTLSQTLLPILLLNDSLSLPEYPIGGHNKFIGFYSDYDTVRLYLQFGYGVGGYDKYNILGVRTE
jgi:hypothetical protein